jgi:hypothetical protein
MQIYKKNSFIYRKTIKKLELELEELEDIFGQYIEQAYKIKRKPKNKMVISSKFMIYFKKIQGKEFLQK